MHAAIAFNWACLHSSLAAELDRVFCLPIIVGEAEAARQSICVKKFNGGKNCISSTCLSSGQKGEQCFFPYPCSKQMEWSLERQGTIVTELCLQRRGLSISHAKRSHALRAIRSPLRVLLVYCTKARRTIVPMGCKTSKIVIAALSQRIRDTDCIGWYREEHIVGVLLTLCKGDSVVAGCHRIQTRIQENLINRLPPEQTCSLQIRVCSQDAITEIALLQPQ